MKGEREEITADPQGGVKGLGGGVCDSGMKRARVVVDKEMTLEFPVREHYLMSCSPPRLIVLQLCNSNIGEVLYSRAFLTSLFGRSSVFD